MNTKEEERVNAHPHHHHPATYYSTTLATAAAGAGSSSGVSAGHTRGLQTWLASIVPTAVFNAARGRRTPPSLQASSTGMAPPSASASAAAMACRRLALSAQSAPSQPPAASASSEMPASQTTLENPSPATQSMRSDAGAAPRTLLPTSATTALLSASQPRLGSGGGATLAASSDQRTQLSRSAPYVTLSPTLLPCKRGGVAAASYIVEYMQVGGGNTRVIDSCTEASK